jgi:hypothetical protein
MELDRLMDAAMSDLDDKPLPKGALLRIELLVIKGGDIAISKVKTPGMSERASLMLALQTVNRLGESLLVMLDAEKDGSPH